MKYDPTEVIRKEIETVLDTNTTMVVAVAEANGGAMTTAEMTALYDVLGFLSPFVVVRRKSDGKKGSLMFTHDPRRYFSFKED